MTGTLHNITVMFLCGEGYPSYCLVMFPAEESCFFSFQGCCGKPRAPLLKRHPKQNISK